MSSAKPAFKRILLKLSGEALMGDDAFGINRATIVRMAEEIAEMTIMAAEEMQRIGVTAKAALLSHSDFGSVDSPSARKMRDALTILRRNAPNMEAEGEMNADTAIDPLIRERIFPNSRLTGSANLLVFPNIDAANIAVNLLKSAGNGLLVGPLLLGAAAPVHILTPSVTARGLMNATALAVVDAQQETA